MKRLANQIVEGFHSADTLFLHLETVISQQTLSLRDRKEAIGIQTLGAFVRPALNYHKGGGMDPVKESPLSNALNARAVTKGGCQSNTANKGFLQVRLKRNPTTYAGGAAPTSCTVEV